MTCCCACRRPGFPSGRRAQLDLIPEDSAALKRAAKKLGLTLSARKTGFLVQGEDRVGAMSDLLDRLATAKINITAVDAVTSGDGRFGAILWVQSRAGLPSRLTTKLRSALVILRHGPTGWQPWVTREIRPTSGPKATPDRPPVNTPSAMCTVRLRAARLEVLNSLTRWRRLLHPR